MDDFSINSSGPQSAAKLATSLAADAGKVDVDPTDARVSACITAAVGIAEDLGVPVLVSIYGQHNQLRVHVDVYEPPVDTKQPPIVSDPATTMASDPVPVP